MFINNNHYKIEFRLQKYEYLYQFPNVYHTDGSP